MGVTRNLGGDRLGSGNKLNVSMHGYERSTHDLGYVWRSTMSVGTLVPFMKLVALPGDTFDIDLEAYLNTHPTIGPLFGSFKMQLDIFEAPIRLYQGLLHNNKIGIGLRMQDVKLPVLSQVTTEMPATTPNPPDWFKLDFDNLQINPSCILAYLGIRGVGLHTAGSGEQIRHFNAIPFLAYWEIYKQYYSNKQEGIGVVIHAPLTAVAFTVVAATAYDQGNTNATVIPQTPATSTPAPFILHDGSFLQVTFTGTFDPDLFLINTTNGPKTATQMWKNIVFDMAGQVTMYEPDWSVLGGTGSAIWQWNYVPAGYIIQDAQPKLTVFNLEDIDTMRDRILAQGATQFNVNTQLLTPYKYVLDREGTAPNYHYSRLSSQEGLGVKTYQSDQYNNWLNSDDIDAINLATKIDTTSGGFTIDALQLAKKVYDLLNRISVSGGTYDDWLDVTYTHERYTRAESPIYHGGLIKEIVFEEVISQADANSAEAGNQPLGTLAGKGKLSDKHKGGRVTINVSEPGYIMGIVSITPRIDYSQGNAWDTHLDTMDDLHKPALDEIGFQDLPTEQLAWWDNYYDVGNGGWQNPSAGKQPAWLNYMTAVNEVRGNFAIRDNQMFMVLNRNYSLSGNNPSGGLIGDLTTYIDPTKFNHIFAQTSLDAQNFWVQIGANVTARRKMSAKLMPNL